VDSGLPQFYIPASSSLQERRPRTLKHGDNFAIFDHYGDIVGGPENPEGLYYRDTRHLSTWRLSVAGLRPLLLSSTVQHDNALFNVDLTNPDTQGADGIALPRGTLHIMRRKFLWQQACHETIALRNYGRQPHTVELVVDFHADFADIFEVRGQKRERRGTLAADLHGPDAMVFVYRGLDAIERRTEITFNPAPATLSTTSRCCGSIPGSRAGRCAFLPRIRRRASTP
jgi:glycogen debranching enzyme